MGINKVVVNDVVKLDLTADTVSPSTLATGITAHDKSGNIITGTALTGFTADDLKFSGNLSNFNVDGRFDRIINKYFDNVKLGVFDTSDKAITSLESAFSGCSLSKIPDISLNSNGTSKLINASSMFRNCLNLTQLPVFIKDDSFNKIYNLQYMFSGCKLITNIPNNYLSPIVEYDSTTTNSASSMFSKCENLKEMSDNNILVHCDDYSSMFYNCYSLNKIVDLTMPNKKFTSNKFYNIFKNCVMLSQFTFSSNGEYQWKSQVIDFTTCGYNSPSIQFTFDNDKCVNNDYDYIRLKDTDDWWTYEVAYSKYDRQSAIATINSLPDASSYIASAGGTNTIKFKNGAGSNTTGGSISDLTAEEIAVATAKGWTVSLVN